MTHKKKRKPFLIFSVFVALLAHAGAIYWLHGKSWDTITLSTEVISKTKDDKIQRNELLEQVFSQIFTNAKIDSIPDSAIGTNKPEQLIALQETPSLTKDSLAPISDSFADNQTQMETQIQTEAKSQNQTQISSNEALEGHFEDGNHVAMDDSASSSNSDLHSNGDPLANTSSGTSLEEGSQHSNPSLSGQNGTGVSRLFSNGMSREGLANKLKARHEVETESGGIAKSGDFSLQVEYAPKSDGGGFIFRLKLVPKENAQFSRIRQNVVYLIDRSHLTRSDTYDASKNAVLEALTLLKDGDTFNVFIFDDKMTRFSLENLSWSEQNVLQAYDFLAKHPYNGSSSIGDFFSSMGNVIPEAVSDREINTAILLSDGETFFNKEKERQYSTLERWTRQNAGKVSLYSVACGKEDHHLALLDMLTAVNKGSSHSALNDEDLQQRMIDLMQTLQNPIGKEIVASVMAPDEETLVSLFPTGTRLPNLYGNSPYVIYGSVNRLEDFQVTFQGKYCDKWLEIKQQVSFQHAKQISDTSLEKMWALQQAYDDYDKYLRSGDAGHLLRAKNLLIENKLPTPF